MFTKRPVAMVTGSSSFLGRAICKKLAEKGYDLILHFNRSVVKTRLLCKEIKNSGAGAQMVWAELRDLRSIPPMVEGIMKKIRRLDLLVNNASLFEPTDPREKSLEGWLETFAVNLHAPYLLSLCAAPWLRKNKGCIINMTDIYGEYPELKHYPAYCASKAGLVNLTKTLAREWGPEIRVNSVSPGAIFLSRHLSNSKKKALLKKSALRRKGTPEEVAEAVHFMVSNGFVDGQVLRVDGGRTL